MKDALTLSRFFILLISITSLLWVSHGYAQKPQDSTSIHTAILLKPKYSNEVSKSFLFFENKVATHLNNNELFDAV